MIINFNLKYLRLSFEIVLILDFYKILIYFFFFKLLFIDFRKNYIISLKFKKYFLLIFQRLTVMLNISYTYIQFCKCGYYKILSWITEKLAY